MEEQIFQSPDNGISNQNPQRSPKKPSWSLGKKILIGLVSGLGLILIFVMLYKTNSVAFLTHLRYQNYSGQESPSLTYKDYQSVKRGDSIDSVIEKFGKGKVKVNLALVNEHDSSGNETGRTSRSWFRAADMSVGYGSSYDGKTFVSLTFRREGLGHYVLDYKFITNAQDGKTFRLEDSPKKRISRSDFKKLHVGDSYSGQGGITYQEVVDRIGYPSGNQITDYIGHNRELRISYYRDKSDGSKDYSVSLTFDQGQDGRYYLKQKDGDFK